MPALSNEGLFAKLRAALPAGSRFETPAATIHPAVADIPGFGRTRCYLWTVTPDDPRRGQGHRRVQDPIDYRRPRAGCPWKPRHSRRLHSPVGLLSGLRCLCWVGSWPLQELRLQCERAGSRRIARERERNGLGSCPSGGHRMTWKCGLRLAPGPRALHQVQSTS